MARLGEDAFRFTAMQFKRLNWVVELHQDDERHASGSVTFYGPGNKKVGWLSLYLTVPEYDQVMGKIDAALAHGDRTPVSAQPGSLVVCTDGDFYSSERLKRGKSTWITSSCGFEDDPNEDVRNMLLDVFQRNICAYRPVLAPCPPAK